ncbi:hypothetical protein NX059_006562 [Plenodomus lindquistii]|nr:hypothetical protein NX059_006562 [Plenodomus lindquistii]
MSARARAYLDALLALSRNTALSDTRQQLIESITGEDLRDVIQLGITDHVPQSGLVSMACKLFEIVAEAQAPAASMTVGPHEQAHTCTMPVPVPPYVNIPIRGTEMSTNAGSASITLQSSRKRAQQNEEENPPKKKNRDDQIGEENLKDIIDPDLVDETNKNAVEVTVNIFELAKNTSFSWTRASEGSVMISLENTVDASYTRCADIEAMFPICCQTNNGWEQKWRSLSDAPDTLVSDLIMSLNTDSFRTVFTTFAWKSMIQRQAEFVNYQGCLRSWIKTSAEKQVHREEVSWEAACEACASSRTLCVGLNQADDGLVKLVLRPLPEKKFDFGAWQSVSYWVREKGSERKVY